MQSVRIFRCFSAGVLPPPFLPCGPQTQTNLNLSLCLTRSHYQWAIRSGKNTLRIFLIITLHSRNSFGNFFSFVGSELDRILWCQGAPSNRRSLRLVVKTSTKRNIVSRFATSCTLCNVLLSRICKDHEVFYFVVKN